jgi:hypothetical protein
MSTRAHFVSNLPSCPNVLDELLHSLSQPLTGLRCSLELSLDLPLELSPGEVAELQQENVATALQQTERVIGMIQLMREYLDADQPRQGIYSTALAPALRSVIEELSSIAAVRSIQLRLVGTCTAMLPAPEPRLRLALQYLIATMIDAQPVGAKVTLLLGEGPAGAVLRAEGERRFRDPVLTTAAPAATLRRVKLAIATRMLETAGASLVFSEGDVGPAGFVLRIPRRVGAAPL